MTRLLYISFLGFLFLILSETVSGYGWGYGKNDNHEPPHVGKYGDIIKQHQAYYVDPTGDKNIYLTFDNGYEQGYTGRVLDVLQKHRVPAIFFVTGHYVRTAPDLIKRMVEDGHIIGNHSETHPDFTTVSKEVMKRELDLVEAAVAQITSQQRMMYLRPPRGTFNEETLTWADELGYVHVFWSLAFKDWDVDAQKGWQYAYDEMMAHIHPGAIVLLHSVSSDNAEALDKVITDLKQEGYIFRSLDDLILKNELQDPLNF